MVNSVLRGAGRLANTMFGRSNSLSINTGAANSTLYASSPPLTSSSSNTSLPSTLPKVPAGRALLCSAQAPIPTNLLPVPRVCATNGATRHRIRLFLRTIANSSLTAPRKPHRRQLLSPFHILTLTGRFLLVQERRALAFSLQPPETMCRILFLRLDRVSGLSQTMSRHLHMRQLSELSQTFCNVFRSGFKTTTSCHLHQLLELNQTMSCHLHIRPLHSLVRHQSFPTRRHRLTSQIRGRLRKKLAMDRGSTPLGAKQLLPKILSSIQISSYLRHRGCRHARKSDLCTKDGWLLTLQINSFDLI
jgi:hypothetical protein